MVNFYIHGDDNIFLDDVLEYLQKQDVPIFVLSDDEKGIIEDVICPAEIDDILDEFSVKRFKKIYLKYANKNYDKYVKFKEL